MLRVSGIDLPLDYTEQQLLLAAARKARIQPSAVKEIILVKRSVDARKKPDLHFNFIVDLRVKGRESEIVKKSANREVRLDSEQHYQPCITELTAERTGLRPVVVGSGPAGLFAALILALNGLQPLLLERGADVEQRTEVVELFRRQGVLDLQTNVQFGEGGAGTFSDGKLNSGIKDVRCRFVLEQLAAACSDRSLDHILWQARPHAGTDKLRLAVKGLRQKIIGLGGTVCFKHQVMAIKCRINAAGERNICGLTVMTPDGEREIECRQAVFAVGHSARDTLVMLQQSGVVMQPKAFAVGLRIEHPRQEVDACQYGAAAGHPALGAADYKLSCTTGSGRGVYTFCMCPGGTVIAAASEKNGVVVNGMSDLARSAVNSNSAVLVGVTPADFGSAEPLAGIDWQRKLEQAAYIAGGGNFKAPVQLVGDFLKDVPSRQLGEVEPSYLPGVALAELKNCLPEFVISALREGLDGLGKQMSAFKRYDAVLTGVESRSSSPVRWYRNEQGESNIGGLYPCGEGAGYAGGIISAAVDGIKCAEQLLRS